MNTFPFGYKGYYDAYNNAVRLSIEEAKRLKPGDKVITLITNDSDDDYSLKNRLHEFVVDDVNSDYISVDGFTFYFEDGVPEHDGACLIHVK
jgi:hypothetical protein